MSQTKYYRILNEQILLDNWRQGKFNSYHRFLAGEWVDLYYKKNETEGSKFPLDTTQGKHTLKALRAFLCNAKKYKIGDRWSDTHVLEAGELDGVCAFKDPASLLHYVDGSIHDKAIVVVFEGDYVSDIPESDINSSGVLVHPTKTIECMRLGEFKGKWTQPVE
jgi:hypothetical protein